MATQVVTLSNPDSALGQGRSLIATAAAMGNADSTANVATLGFDEAALQISGTFGVGGSVTIEGSFDGTNFFALPGTSAITAAGIASITAVASRFLRARVTAGDGTTALVAVFFLRTRSRGMT